MYRNSILNRIVFILLLFCVFISQSVFALDIIVNNDVTISAKVNPTNNNGNGNGGGGGGGGGILNLITTVNFSGMAYPLSRVYILKDGDIAVTTIADQAANFSVSLTGLSTDTYTFSIYGEDSNNRKSSFFSFPIYITEGTTVNIGNIFLSPTIDVNKSQVKRGDNLIIFGQSVPQNEVVISVHSDQEHFFRVVSNAMGAYLYNLDTSILENGKHQTKSKTTLDTQVSLYATPVSFLVGDESILKDETDCSLFRGDLNCDNHVNLIDFSIMAFWYKKINPPQKIDLSNDGKITLVDFSIMAFYWTG
jgi:hypothetical protein